jgi:hypothetical protein
LKLNSYQQGESTDNIKAYFAPQPDITAYELGRIVARMNTPLSTPNKGITFRKKTWDELDPALKRHFNIAAPVDPDA